MSDSSRHTKIIDVEFDFTASDKGDDIQNMPTFKKISIEVNEPMPLLGFYMLLKKIIDNYPSSNESVKEESDEA